MGKITCVHGIQVGMCRCMKDNHGGTGKCPPECSDKKKDMAGKFKCPECKRKVLEIVKTSGVCWKCHVGSVQKGKLK